MRDVTVTFVVWPSLSLSLSSCAGIVTCVALLAPYLAACGMFRAKVANQVRVICGYDVVVML
jgi:hypothetical protein